MVGFGFWLEITGEKSKPVISAEIAGEYQFSKLFLVKKIMSTDTQSCFWSIGY